MKASHLPGHHPETTKRIIHKLEALFRKYQQLKTKVAELEQRNAQLQKTLEEEREKKKDFTDQESVAKIADYQTVEGMSTSQLREELDGYIADLEDCIALLEAQTSHHHI